MLIYLFTKELDNSLKIELSNNLVKNAKNEFWVYKKVNDELILINNNEPTFKSKN